VVILINPCLFECRFWIKRRVLSDRKSLSPEWIEIPTILPDPAKTLERFEMSEAANNNNQSILCDFSTWSVK
jgi:hypothetical protein